MLADAGLMATCGSTGPCAFVADAPAALRLLLEESDKEQRQEVVWREQLRQAAIRQEVAELLSAGRISLQEAARRFCPPSLREQMRDPRFAQAFPGASLDEQVYRYVIDRVCEQQSAQSPAAGQALRQRLESEWQGSGSVESEP
jgi:hypothetical protein